ncbi:MAG TPA: hypothetical protein VN376_00445 [Longilinea sp.]|nr:hypothetical protein [Longilinea sp.]
MNNNKNSQKTAVNRDLRRRRIQQIIMIVISLILIVSWILTLVITI